MGEAKKGALKIRFDRRLRLEFHGTRITLDAGLLACRELDDALGLTVRAPVQLQEIRHGRNIQHELAPLLRQSVYSRLAGYEDTNDAERLAQDPAMQAVVGRRALEKQAAGANTLSRFETEVLTREENLKGLSELNREWVDRAMAHSPHQRIILDMDSSESPVHGEQEGTAYNGHFRCTCYHPLFCFNLSEFFLPCLGRRSVAVALENPMMVVQVLELKQRPPHFLYGGERAHPQEILLQDADEQWSGTAKGRCCGPPVAALGRMDPHAVHRAVHSADGWRELLSPIAARYERAGVRRYFRADAAFARPEVYECLEAHSFLYAIRLPANDVVQREIDFLLTRPVGRPPKRPIIFYYDFRYQAGSWDRSRRVVAKVEWHSGELFPRVGFIVTNLTARPEGVVHFYNQRGTAEQWIKEGKYALNWTRLSCHRFVCNQVRLLLFVLAYNLGNFLRRLALPRGLKHWSLRSLQVKLIKMGGRIVRHARQIIFQLAEVAVSREEFAIILDRINRLRPVPV